MIWFPKTDREYSIFHFGFNPVLTEKCAWNKSNKKEFLEKELKATLDFLLLKELAYLLLFFGYKKCPASHYAYALSTYDAGFPKMFLLAH